MAVRSRSKASTVPVDKRENIQKGDLMCFQYYGTVDTVESRNSLLIHNVDNGEKFRVNGEELIKASMSADLYETVQTVSKTEAAEILVHSRNVPFTVVFEKLNGEMRTLRGRLIDSKESILGRVKVMDLDKKDMRQVDCRTIHQLIVGKIKYVVK